MNRHVDRIALVLFTLGYALAAADGTSGAYVERRYAPDRQVDILHVAIDVTPDFDERTIRGSTTIRFAPIAKPLHELSLSAVDLTVTSVSGSTQVLDYSTTDEDITIRFDAPIAPGEETTVAITYEAEPKRGLYFRTPEMGYPEEDMHLFTQGESHQAPHWYPSYDYPNERSTTEVTCRVPSDMTVLSNGRLVAEKIDPESGLKAVTWLQGKPHVNYLVALAAGRFKKIESRYKQIPLAFYTPTSLIDYAENSFRGTADMMAFYEREIGVPYPWDKYDQVAAHDFVAGGMENTTLTILTANTLFSDETENIHSSQGLVAHELVHQWFGDYVTCKDWSHLWLNEGFAVYYENLYDGHRNGHDSLLYGMYQDSGSVLRDRPAEKPIVWRGYEHAGQQFDYRAYPKGGWVVHMLRCELGEELFRRCIRTYLERHALGCVVTADLASVVEELSGRSFDQFFDQWVYHAGFPKLTISYKWQGKDKLAKVSVKQTQNIGENVLLFRLPTKVRFVVDGEPVDKEILVDATEHDFYFALEKEPTVVRFDPEYGVLAKVKFEKPTAMLYAQLADQNDVIGRLFAVEALKKKADKKTVARLKTALEEDSFWGVRKAAAQALREIHTDEAFTALAESVDQSDARVRLQVVEDIGRFYRPESLELMQQTVADSRNPEIKAAAIENLGRYQGDRTRELVLAQLRHPSFRNRVARAAVEAMRMLDDPCYIAPLREVAVEGREGWSAASFSRVLDTLAQLARNEEDKTSVREVLVSYVDHPSQRIQAGALAALGTLGDAKAIPIVQTFARDEAGDRVARAARGALDRLEQEKKLVPQEVVELRKAVRGLKDDNEKLRDELEEIKERLDAEDSREPAGDDAAPGD